VAYPVAVPNSTRVLEVPRVGE
jgi:hypothetical protein